MKKLRVGILGATGMVGQRFIQLLDKHPWFEVVVVAASSKSAGNTYENAMKERWKMNTPIPLSIKSLIVSSVVDDREKVAKQVDFVFCALDLDKIAIQKIEESYASLGIPVVSNNSANRFTSDIPMIIPEVNGNHCNLIPHQQKRRGWKIGFIVVKPNCSIQSYTSIIAAWKKFKPRKMSIVSLQAISGAGKTFETMPEMRDTVVPFIQDEEEKSEKEPLKILGEMRNDTIVLEKQLEITATCLRVPVSDGHMAIVSVSFARHPSIEDLVTALKEFNNNNFLTDLNLPSAPTPLIQYFTQDQRPQIRLDRDYGNGMGISIGRLRKAKQYDYSFVALAHNTIRGAAGGAILTAELLVKKGYLT